MKFITIINTARTKNTQDWKGYTILITRNKRGIYAAKVDVWMKYLGNRGQTVEDYKKWLAKEFDWNNKISEFMGIHVDKMKRRKEITMLCFCEDVNKCHRKVLAEWLCENYPDCFTLGEIK
jgi:uncharacterized protein YeaO (DUF488 family)